MQAQSAPWPPVPHQQQPPMWCPICQGGLSTLCMPDGRPQLLLCGQCTGQQLCALLEEAGACQLVMQQQPAQPHQQCYACLCCPAEPVVFDSSLAYLAHYMELHESVATVGAVDDDGEVEAVPITFEASPQPPPPPPRQTGEYSCQHCGDKFCTAGQLDVHLALCQYNSSDSKAALRLEVAGFADADDDDDLGGDAGGAAALAAATRGRHSCDTCGRGFRLTWRYLLHVQAGACRGVAAEAATVAAPGTRRKAGGPGADRTCGLCGKVFANPMNLHRHELIHADIRRHSCRVCGKAFVQKTQLETHMNVHRGVRPFQCGVCRKSFTDRSTFHKHRKTHAKPSSFECHVCGKEFSQAGYLSLHAKVHYKAERAGGAKPILTLL